MDTRIDSTTNIFLSKQNRKDFTSSSYDCRNELNRLRLTTTKNTNRKLVNFEGFPDSAHQAELERYQGHKKLDDKYPLHDAHGRLNYDLHDKNWILHSGINNPCNCKADTKEECQEIIFFD